MTTTRSPGPASGPTDRAAAQQAAPAADLVTLPDLGAPASSATSMPDDDVREPIFVGRLEDADTGLPLAGLIVSAGLIEGEDVAGTTLGTILGTATSLPDGRFSIAPFMSPEVDRALCLLRECRDETFAFAVDAPGKAGDRLIITDPRPFGLGAMTIEVPAPRRSPSATTMRTLAKRSRAAGIARLSDLVSNLSDGSTSSVFADWDAGTRLGVLQDLERAFLDPSGVLSSHTQIPSMRATLDPKVSAAFEASLADALTDPEVSSALANFMSKTAVFSDLSQVHWPIDPSAIHGAQIEPDFFLSPIGILWGPTLQGYRDYLRSIWTGAATGYDFSTREQGLRDRLHQDFTTSSGADEPANEIVIRILTEILTAAPGPTYGFGLAPAAVPARNAGEAARDYLDRLIAVTGVDGDELGRRYRLNVVRPDVAVSNEVQENVTTLQRFYSDGFQSQADPVAEIPALVLGKAPFYLEYEEWSRLNGPFFPENLYQVTSRLVTGAIDPDRGEKLKALPKPGDWGLTQADIDEFKRFVDTYVVEWLVQQGAASLRHLELVQARAYLQQAVERAEAALFPLPTFSKTPEAWFVGRKKQSITTIDDLARYMAMDWQDPIMGWSDDDDAFVANWRKNWSSGYSGNTDTVMNVTFALLHLAMLAIPTLLGDVAMGLGDHGEAVWQYGRTTRFLVGRANLDSGGGYSDGTVEQLVNGGWGDFELYARGALGYTVDVHERTGDRYYPYVDGSGAASLTEQLAHHLVSACTNPVEARFYRLRQGNAILDWADELYRTEDASSVARARELYKAVWFLHGETPPIDPHWTVQFIPPSWYGPQNPAVTAQLARAELGFTQIEEGLNYFGYTDELVPILRYRSLSDAANASATMARSAQADLLGFMEKIEAELIENMRTANLLKKADLQGQVAGEQVQIAKVAVKQAQVQVDQVKGQITAKEKEQADHDSFWGQLTDFIGGMVDVVGKLPGGVTSGVSAGFMGELSGEETAGLLGLGAGASVMAGFGIFYAVGTMSMSSMASAANKRDSDLKTLRDTTLPLAQAQVDARNREVRIAELAGQIAAADAELAHQLMAFQDQRFLSVEFWSSMATIMQRLLRRYLEMGARFAWLAERALAYEQDRTIDLIRLDYYPDATMGISGADLLLLDLAQLEASRLDAIKETVPIIHTYSLARDFPLQFAELRTTGSCSFHTEEAPLHVAYPGTYGYRVRAVTVAIRNTGLQTPLRGLLTNVGVSGVSAADGSTHGSVRPSDALPLSEFRLRDDMAVYSLPDEALMSFEGSGVDTVWGVELAPAANPQGLGGMVDLLVTLDLRASFSTDVYASDVAAMPTSTDSLVLASARLMDPLDLKALIAGPANTVTIAFDMTTLTFPPKQTNRKVTNLFVVAAPGTGKLPISFSATLTAHKPTKKVAIDLVDGAAASNAPPITDPKSTVVLSPLNILVGQPVDQIFTLTIDPKQNPGVDFGTLTDVVLGIDYSADLGP